MDNFEVVAVDSGDGKPCRRKRSNLYRRPQNDSHSPPDYCGSSSMSSTLPSDSQSKASSGDNVDHGAVSGASYSNVNEPEYYPNTGVKETHEFSAKNDSQGMHPTRLIKDNQATPTVSGVETGGMITSDYHSGQSGVVSHGVESNSKVKKVKLKVGGVVRTIHTNTGAGPSLTKSSSSSSVPHQRHKDSSDKGIGLQGIPWKDFSKSGFSFGRSNSSGDIPLMQSAKYKPARKGKHVSKTSRLGELYNTEDDEDDNDDEIRYLEKLKTSKFAASYGGENDEDEEGSKKLQRISKVLNQSANVYDVKPRDYNSKARKERRNSKPVRAFEDNADYVEEEESLSDTELRPKKKHCKDLNDILGSARNEMAMTTRRRALQTGKEVSSLSSMSAVEFPHGLPPPPKKQREKLSEVEQQLKKVEAAQRCRMQAEKAARESEAEAIRKILGQDSSRKKREEKLKKRQEESAQERNARAAAHPSNAIRWVLGPSGTVVTFPNEIGLPSIFEPKSCSYPPPREKCAAPSCTNAYKYRDSKSKLPLCSLQCYKAIHEKLEPLGAC
nr:ABC transporter F family member 4-like [Ipomoea batatas]